MAITKDHRQSETEIKRRFDWLPLCFPVSQLKHSLETNFVVSIWRSQRDPQAMNLITLRFFPEKGLLRFCASGVCISKILLIWRRVILSSFSINTSHHYPKDCINSDERSESYRVAVQMAKKAIPQREKTQ